jgi:hypothetical protein
MASSSAAVIIHPVRKPAPKLARPRGSGPAAQGTATQDAGALDDGTLFPLPDTLF